MGVLLTDPGLALADADCLFAEGISHREPTVFVDRPEVAPRGITETMIVCGNCAGEAANPVKTLLTKAGCCASCGGRSYVLAVNLEVARRVALALEQIALVS